MTDTTKPSRRRSGSSTRQRTAVLALRVTAEEAAQLTADAERAALTVSGYVRAAALGSPGIRAARRPVLHKVELAQALGLLGRVGGNVNQLARAFNTDGTTPEASELATMQGDIHAMRDALMQALGQTP